MSSVCDSTFSFLSSNVIVIHILSFSKIICIIWEKGRQKWRKEGGEGKRADWPACSLNALKPGLTQVQAGSQEFHSSASQWVAGTYGYFSSNLSYLLFPTSRQSSHRPESAQIQDLNPNIPKWDVSMPSGVLNVRPSTQNILSHTSVLIVFTTATFINDFFLLSPMAVTTRNTCSNIVTHYGRVPTKLQPSSLISMHQAKYSTAQFPPVKMKY